MPDVNDRPWVNFNVATKEYYHRTGMNLAGHRLRRYLREKGLDKIQSNLGKIRSVLRDNANDRIETFATTGMRLLTGYAEGPSRNDRWRVTIAKDRVLHQFARRLRKSVMFSEHRIRPDIQSVAEEEPRIGTRLSRRKRKRLFQPKPNIHPRIQPDDRLDIVLAVGNLNVIHLEHIPGRAMALKRFVNILKNYGYVREVVSVNESRTSQECHKCYRAGNPTVLHNVRMRDKKQWKLLHCNRCNTYWNRDLNAALNIRSVWIHGYLNQGQRPVNFISGFRGHAPL
jgi:DNA-directed RNA polymerase subunit M/transcription elongation factor TFIIS